MKMIGIYLVRGFGNNVVDARELHKFLNRKDSFVAFYNQFIHGSTSFKEKTDYLTFPCTIEGIQSYGVAITRTLARHIAVLSNSSKGKEVVLFLDGLTDAEEARAAEKVYADNLAKSAKESNTVIPTSSNAKTVEKVAVSAPVNTVDTSGDEPASGLDSTTSENVKPTKLDKNSSQVDIRAYFEAVIQLARSKEEYPVDIDDVWMLEYSTKGNAIKALEKNFMQDVDYQLFIQNDNKLEISKLGKKPTTIYKLSTSCLEYFIARKNRDVFNVYREVFHKAVEVASYQISDPIERAKAWIVEKEAANLLQASNKAFSKTIALQKPKVEFHDRLMSSETAIAIGQFAKMLRVGPNVLFAKLREDGYLMSAYNTKNTPYQKYITNGYFELKETVTTVGENQIIKLQTLVTPKGQHALTPKYYVE